MQESDRTAVLEATCRQFKISPHAVHSGSHLSQLSCLIVDSGVGQR